MGDVSEPGAPRRYAPRRKTVSLTLHILYGLEYGRRRMKSLCVLIKRFKREQRTRTTTKKMKTTSGHNVIICDKPGGEYIELRDKDNSFLRMDDKDSYIRIEDKNWSYILMTGGNIEIHAVGNMKLTASKIDLN